MGVLMRNEVSRRAFLGALAGGFSAAMSTGHARADFLEAAKEETLEPISNSLNPEHVRFSLNLGTIRSYDLNLKQELEVARDAGYRSVEIWLDRLADYTRGADNKEFDSSKLRELRNFLDSEGLRVEGGIGFASWIAHDDDRRAAGLDELRRQAEALAILGAGCVAAPAAGVNERVELSKIADRYRATLELCEPYGVRPILELWGVSPALSRVADGLAICADTGCQDAALLLDVYHMYRGGNSFASLSLISGSALPIFHINDYPATPGREQLNDSDRVFPGDGAAPWRQILTTLGKNGFNGALSFEIFNRSYRDKYSALEQAKIGLEKMRALFD